MFRTAASRLVARSSTRSAAQQCHAAASRSLATFSARSAAARAPLIARTFATTAQRPAGSTSLSAKLAEELIYEQENTEQEEPEFLRSVREAGVWTISDKAGSDEVLLERSYGSETIQITLSVSDVSTPEENEAFEEDAEESAAAESGEESADESDNSFPVRASVSITKADKEGALFIDAVATDGVFQVDNVAMYSSRDLAIQQTAEADWARRGLYMGPEFSNLDESLQAEFEGFLEERGIDSGLALFCVDLVEYKEQREYMRWLDQVKSFVEA